MYLKGSTRKYQERLAEYCRTGAAQDIPGLTPNRVQHYRRLITNIIDDTLQSAYPLTLHLLTQEEWSGLVNRFFSKTPCRSPQVWKMPLELFEYISRNDAEHELKKKHPFLEELIYFEWVELELYMMEDRSPEINYLKGDVLKDSIVFNAESRLLTFEYPVHIKPAGTIAEQDRGNYFCLCYREPKDQKILFKNLSPLFAHLITELDKGRSTGEILNEIAANLEMDPNKLRQEARTFLSKLKEDGFILGFR